MMASLFTFAIIAILILIAPYVSKLTKIPIVVVEIVLGALGYYFGIFKHSEGLTIVAEVGFLFLMFLCGMEVDLRGFKQLGKEFLKKAGMYFLVLYVVATSAVLILKLPPIYIAAFPVMSLGMIMALIKDYGKNMPWLDLALKIGIIGELVSIAVLVIINGSYSYGLTIELYKTLAVLLLFLLVIVGLFQLGKILFWWFPNLKLFIMPYNDENNQDIRFSMMLFFGLIVIVMWLGLEIVLGAFLAGMVVATFFPYKHELVHKLNDIGFGFFVPLFFVHVGSTLDLSLVLHTPSLLAHGAFIVVGMISLRLVSATIAFRKYFKNAKNTVLFALSDSMPLTFLVATAALGLQLGAMDQNTYYSFLLAAIFEGVIFTILIKVIYVFWKVPHRPKKKP
ncbi:sodium:proton antiporter [Helicobacter sp. 12S02634-8]|uniref:cation:proton antiporter n=1 Tax=Helicobacter sp. 12S02634-8 TaxID=1476199 RepID=UPI000BCA66A8|nr:cation:proton antiporter [Helicobacter sp. 12S02634-8]PAF47384.1 sodium:proton antiporter [Helicobacter sp. 12S02634-8]